MALVNVTNVVVLDNPTTFTNPLTFEVTFECLQELDADLEWKVIYVGSAEDERFDQVLEEVDVGPIPVGVNKFVLTAESPDPATIPTTDLVGVTVTLITCCYKQKEFIRVGYYVNNEHTDPAINAEIQEGRIPRAEMLDPALITRNILADKPRVTRFPIDWNAAPEEADKVVAEGETGSAEGAMDEGIMEDDDEMVVGGEEAREEDEGRDDDMGGEGEGGEGSESMGSEGDAEGEDDRSVDLEEEGSGDAEGEADMDADSSGAEEMEDVRADRARVGSPSAGATAAVETTAMPGVLVPTADGGGDENVQPPQSISTVGAQQQHSNGVAQADVVGQVNCGNEGMGPVANTSGGTLLFSS